jgi:hypothetical protein
MAKAFDPKAKAKRQKIIAAVGGVILVVLLVWRVPPMIALMNKKPPPNNSSVTAPAPVAGSPALPVPATPATPGASAALVDNDLAPQPEVGQLVSFDRFVSKDPFAQQLRAPGSGSATAAKPGGRPHKPVKVNEPELDPTPVPKPTTQAPESAQISVDGASETIAVGGSFPAQEPLFKLVSVGKGSAKIAIEGGTYASGAQTLTLKKGRPVTLLNTADGTQYRLLLH